MRYLFIVSSLLYYQLLAAQQVLTFEHQLNLAPEGIAIHPVNGTIYISSIAQKKIIKISGPTTPVDFIREGQDHFLEGLGMKVDTVRGFLWALSNTRKGNEFTSQIHAFDLASGKTMQHYSLTDTVPRLFNDLALDRSGQLFITDTYHSSIYKYDPVARNLELFVHDTSKIKWPNGIDFLNENHLVIATYGNGLVRISIRTKEMSALPGYRDQSLAYGLDGLVANSNFLYGIYNAGKNGYASNAVIRYTLDEQKQRIISEVVIDRGHPAFADPTTAAIFGNRLFVIANSHLDQFNANKETVTGIENVLTPLKLVWYPLE